LKTAFKYTYIPIPFSGLAFFDLGHSNNFNVMYKQIASQHFSICHTWPRRETR